MWFEDLMGFVEGSPEHVRENIEHAGAFLVSRVNGRRVGCGRLEIPNLADLRLRTASLPRGAPARLREVVGDVATLHRDPDNASALFQVASQFNLLEMAHPTVTPEAGVGIYENDHTQGPACAIACGGGTIFRNTFVSLKGGLGQTATRQIDTLEDLGAALGQPGLWEMQNGYAMATAEGLARINARLLETSAEERDALRGRLHIGVQHDVEVLHTDHQVTQVYGAALPVGYGSPPEALWEAFARLVLEASYEATFLVAKAEGIGKVYLTLLGGGVFGNRDAWIQDAILCALPRATGLDVRIVSYRKSNPTVQQIVEAAAALDT